ncbi:MAG: glycosyltransferase family 39 protein [Desulfobaccales bacterium]|nr:glycosyltransferase family 39 protein [Desulfobaccales bacterium]
MRSSSHPTSRLSGDAILLLVLILALGVFVRVYALGGRDLWTDEAWLALAALKSTPAEALAARQSTPPFYVLTLWAAAKFLGGGEAALRSLSCFFGLGTLLLFWPLARGLASPAAALLGLATVAFSPVLVYYAKELKQYSGDAFFAVLVLLLVERLRARRGDKGWLSLALAGILGLGFSHPLIFTLPVAGAVLWFTLPARQQLRVLSLGLVWALGFAVYYFGFFRHEVDPELVVYWSQDFPDFSGAWPFLIWLGGALSRYLEYFLAKWGVFWGPPLLLAGSAALIHQGRSLALIYLGGPLLMALGAAALQRYPFMAHYGGSRLMLFSAPLLYLVAASGMTAIFVWLWQKRQRLLALALTGLLLLALEPVEIIKEDLHPAHNREEIQPLVAHLESQLQPQDLVYVYYHAIKPFKYYNHRPLERICYGKSCVETALKIPESGGSPPQRVWLLASHIPSLEYMRRFAAELLGPPWQETACLTRTGAVLFRFERQDPEADPKTPLAQIEPSVSGSEVPPPDKVYR